MNAMSKTMMMIVLLVAGPAGALAQPVPRSGDVVQVSVTYQVPDGAMPAADPGTKTDRDESLRRMIYEAASRECKTLEQIFQQPCRMTGLTVQPLNRGMPQGPTGMQGSAAYQLSQAPR